PQQVRPVGLDRVEVVGEGEALLVPGLQAPRPVVQAGAGELNGRQHEEQQQPQPARQQQQVRRPAATVARDRRGLGRCAGGGTTRSRADQGGHGATPSGSAAYCGAGCSPCPSGRCSTNECDGYQCTTTSVPGVSGSPADWFAENTDISWPHGVFSRYSVLTPA